MIVFVALKTFSTWRGTCSEVTGWLVPRRKKKRKTIENVFCVFIQRRKEIPGLRNTKSIAFDCEEFLSILDHLECEKISESSSTATRTPRESITVASFLFGKRSHHRIHFHTPTRCIHKEPKINSKFKASRDANDARNKQIRSGRFQKISKAEKREIFTSDRGSFRTVTTKKSSRGKEKVMQHFHIIEKIKSYRVFGEIKEILCQNVEQWKRQFWDKWNWIIWKSNFCEKLRH